MENDLTVRCPECGGMLRFMHVWNEGINEKVLISQCTQCRAHFKEVYKIDEILDEPIVLEPITRYFFG